MKKISGFKSKIEMYKRKMLECHEKELNDEMKYQKLEYEYKDIKETLMKNSKNQENFSFERDRSLSSELERVKEENELLKKTTTPRILSICFWQRKKSCWMHPQQCKFFEHIPE